MLIMRYRSRLLFLYISLLLCGLSFNARAQQVVVENTVNICRQIATPVDLDKVVGIHMSASAGFWTDENYQRVSNIFDTHGKPAGQYVFLYTVTRDGYCSLNMGDQLKAVINLNEDFLIATVDKMDPICGRPTGYIHISTTGGSGDYDFYYSTSKVSNVKGDSVMNALAEDYYVFTIRDRNPNACASDVTLDTIYLSSQGDFELKDLDGALTIGYKGVPYGPAYIEPLQAVTIDVFELDGTLPPGLTFDEETGEISGTPTAAGTYNFSVKAYSTLGCMADKDYEIVIELSCANFDLSEADAESLVGQVGIPFNDLQIGTSDEDGNVITYAHIAGTLPPGLSLDTITGIISGTPTTTGVYPFTIEASIEDLGCVTTKEYTIEIFFACTELRLSPKVITLKQNERIPTPGKQLTVEGNNGSVTFTHDYNDLPAVLLLDSRGMLTGEPKEIGNYVVPVHIVDSLGCDKLDTVLIIVTDEDGISTDLTICAGDTVEYTFVANGFTAPVHYTWSPDEGLLENNTATLKARLDEAGTVIYTLNVVGALPGEELTIKVRVTVNPKPVYTYTAKVGNGYLIEDGTQSIEVSINPSEYSWTYYAEVRNLTYDVSEGPQSSSTLVFSNLPMQLNYNVYTKVTDANGCWSDSDSTITILPYIPNAFTPDGDGINDVFLGNCDDCYLEIFGRWSNLIFQGKGGWDGKYKGVGVSPGTYFFVLKMNDANGQIIKKGSVTVVTSKK